MSHGLQAASRELESPPPPMDAAEVFHRLQEAQEQLAGLQRQLEHQDRLATLGTLAATIAHEFNNLLTPASNYAQLALKSLDGPQPDLELVRKALTKAQGAAVKADRICTAILGFARSAPEAGPEAVSDVAGVVEEALATLGRDPSKEGITLRRQIEPGLKAACDPLQLEQVLVNLLVNAHHAILGGGKRHGTLTIVASRQADVDGERVRIEVTDSGCGIEASRLPHIFEPFHTSRQGAGQGTGLGLSLCKQIIERHGGRIGAESTPARGTSIHVLLPAA